ncbi:MAG: glycoside hydrolase family 3 protein [Phycisphaerales bacterium]|nr:glycoside hydrolase family 3 protein [Phycisphaerales bacterium]
MSLNQDIGSLIMTGIRGASLDDPHCKEDVQTLKSLHIKGVILFDTHLPTGGMRNIINEDQVRTLTDDLRHELGEDLLIAIDQEGGEVNRLGLFKDLGVSEQLSATMQGAMSPAQLGAIIEPVASALEHAGIDLNFAPCVDLCVNPENPIIAGKGRSLGHDPERVARSASTIIEAYAKHGVRCCLKHFPGHGSSTTDTHMGLANITESWIEDELSVYRALIGSINSGSLPMCAVMTGHLMHHLQDPLLPASMSHMHTTTTLRDLIGFEGLVITDSIDMGAIRDHHDAGAAAVLALQAGADVVLDGFNSPSDSGLDHPAPQIHESLMRGVEQGTIPFERVAESVDRRKAFHRFELQNPSMRSNR